MQRGGFHICAIAFFVAGCGGGLTWVGLPYEGPTLLATHAGGQVSLAILQPDDVESFELEGRTVYALEYPAQGVDPPAPDNSGPLDAHPDGVLMTSVAELLELDPASASWRVTKEHPSWMSEVRLPYRRATRCREYRRKDVLRMDDGEVAFGIVRGPKILYGRRSTRNSSVLLPSVVLSAGEDGLTLEVLSSDPGLSAASVLDDGVEAELVAARDRELLRAVWTSTSVRTQPLGESSASIGEIAGFQSGGQLEIFAMLKSGTIAWRPPGRELVELEIQAEVSSNWMDIVPLGPGEALVLHIDLPYLIWLVDGELRQIEYPPESGAGRSMIVVPGLGPVLGSRSGWVYRVVEGRLEPLVELGALLNLNQLTPTENGFAYGVGSGAFGVWRQDEGLCPSSAVFSGVNALRQLTAVELGGELTFVASSAVVEQSGSVFEWLVPE